VIGKVIFYGAVLWILGMVGSFLLQSSIPFLTPLIADFFVGIVIIGYVIWRYNTAQRALLNNIGRVNPKINLDDYSPVARTSIINEYATGTPFAKFLVTVLPVLNANRAGKVDKELKETYHEGTESKIEWERYVGRNELAKNVYDAELARYKREARENWKVLEDIGYPTLEQVQDQFKAEDTIDQEAVKRVIHKELQKNLFEKIKDMSPSEMVDMYRKLEDSDLKEITKTALDEDEKERSD